MTDEYRKFYNELNEQQRLAVDAVDGQFLVLAGPGTGKTQLLSVRAASILNKSGIGPENILILTYTNSAARTMKERLARITGPAGYEIEVGTFHGFANSILRESDETINYVGDKILMDDVERMRVIEYILDNSEGLDDIRPFRAPYTYLKEVLARISAMKKDGITPDALDGYLKNGESRYRQMEDKYVKRLAALAKIYRMYEELKEGGNRDIFDERGRYDFDDIILFAAEALDKEAALKDEYQKEYRYVMVDEFQDTNDAQMKLLLKLLDYDDPNLLCVGDDDQSIYRFQGASVANFKLLAERFPAMKTFHLKDNYRSTSELINASSKIIDIIPLEDRVGAKSLVSMRRWKEREIAFREFTTQAEELLYIVDKVKELAPRIGEDEGLTMEERRHPYNNIAILVRKRGDILKIIDAFLSAGIPYATDGKEDISGERRVKQLLDVLDLARCDGMEDDEKDLVLYRVLTSDYFEIPHCDILRFLRYVNSKKTKGRRRAVTFLEEFLRYPSLTTIKLERPDRMRHAADVIGKLLADSSTRSVHSILMNFVKNSGIFKYILKAYADNDILRIRELRSLTSFINMVKAGDMARPAMRLDEFMAEMKTRKDHDLPIEGSLVTLTQAGVRVYTAHGSKGLEFHSVIIPFCLQNKNWPVRMIPERIQLPLDLFRMKGRLDEKRILKQLALQDETRLFYVAITRARANLIFTASPSENSISSSYLNCLDISGGEGLEERAEEEIISRSLDQTDMEDPFIGTEEVLRDMLRDISLNPTRLNNYITCRRKFLYNDVLRLPGAKKKSLVFGNCVHKALERTYDRYKARRVFPAFNFFEDIFRGELMFQGADKDMARDCLNKLKTIRPWFERSAAAAVMPISLEKKLLITVGENIVFTGKYDKLEWDDESRGLVKVVDYKTGKPDDHLKRIEGFTDPASPECDGYLRQLVCYKLLFERNRRESRGRKAGSGELVFIEPVSSDMKGLGYKKGDYVTKRVAISQEMVKELDALIKAVWSDIKSLRFEKLAVRDEKKCGPCDFEAICWR